MRRQLLGGTLRAQPVLIHLFTPGRAFLLQVKLCSHARQAPKQHRVAYISKVMDVIPSSSLSAVTENCVNRDGVSALAKIDDILLHCRMDDALLLKSSAIVANFLRIKEPSTINSSVRRNLVEASILAADKFRTTASSTTGLDSRRALKHLWGELLGKSEDDDDIMVNSSIPDILALLSIALALAIGSETEQAQNRAATSAISSIVRHVSHPEIVQSFINTLLIRCSISKDNNDVESDPLTIDWHIVTCLARVFQVDVIHHREAALATSSIVRQALHLDDDERMPDKTQATAVLALAAQLKPWEVLHPVLTIKPAILLDLYHGAERICVSVIELEAKPNDKIIEAVHALVSAAIEARTYRRADTFATKFYENGGRCYFLKARLLHARSTIAKLVRRGAFPVIEKQIDRIDKAVARTLEDGVEESGEAKDEIRSFTLNQLGEAGNIETAHRLATIWGVKYVYNEAAIEAAKQVRKKKYIQWENVLSGHPPDLVSTPAALLDAFRSLTARGGDRFGFDVEWSEDTEGADILQLASLQTAILVDVPALSKTQEGVEALTATVGKLFASPLATVVGFSCRQDISKLRSSRCTGGNHWLDAGIDGVVDIQRLITEREPKLKQFGLSRACQLYLNKPLDKSEQCSLWKNRPLTKQQRIYAALDAWVCVALHQKLFPNLKRKIS